MNCTGGGSAAGYGNDELALQLNYKFLATGHMMEFGEINALEVKFLRHGHAEQNDSGAWTTPELVRGHDTGRYISQRKLTEILTVDRSENAILSCRVVSFGGNRTDFRILSSRPFLLFLKAPPANDGASRLITPLDEACRTRRRTDR